MITLASSRVVQYRIPAPSPSSSLDLREKQGRCWIRIALQATSGRLGTQSLGLTIPRTHSPVIRACQGVRQVCGLLQQSEVSPYPGD